MMKLAFSTLGCPDWRFSEIFATAKDLQFDGIEVRGVANELYVPKIRAFDSEHIEKNLLKLREGHLEIPMLTSGISIGIPYEKPLEEACEYMDLAKKLRCPFIRVMISSHPQPEDADLKQARELYLAMCKYGESRGVTPLIETNGVLAESKVMDEFMESVDSGNKGVLWDIHHPYRYFGEEPHETYRNIGRYVRYVHVKDSAMKGETLIYRMMGYGDVPIFDALKLLKENQYNGYISLEWVKRWNPDLEGAGIVFAHFMSYITFLISRL